MDLRNTVLNAIKKTFLLFMLLFAPFNVFYSPVIKVISVSLPAL